MYLYRLYIDFICIYVSIIYIVLIYYEWMYIIIYIYTLFLQQATKKRRRKLLVVVWVQLQVSTDKVPRSHPPIPAWERCLTACFMARRVGWSMQRQSHESHENLKSSKYTSKICRRIKIRGKKTPTTRSRFLATWGTLTCAVELSTYDASLEEMVPNPVLDLSLCGSVSQQLCCCQNGYKSWMFHRTIATIRMINGPSISSLWVDPKKICSIPKKWCSPNEVDCSKYPSFSTASHFLNGSTAWVNLKPENSKERHEESNIIKP